MQFKKSAVVGVLIMLYLSTDSWCHYIPERKTTTATKKNSTSAQAEKMQICGTALTTILIEVCNGIFGSFNQDFRNSDSTEITEACCHKGCTWDDLEIYCGETSHFRTKKTPAGKLLNKLTKNRASDPGAGRRATEESRKKEFSEVRIRDKKDGKRSRKKRKNSFKWKCAYKSFGHYLLKLDRRGRVRHNAAKASNSINRTWPSIEIGTISPEVDKFGGRPIIVVRQNKCKSC